jgi:hydroxyacylglutathione hydrolase
MEPVIVIPAFGDNFIYLYRYDKNNSLAVDPCDSSAVLNSLDEHNLNLTTILITHHHWDHTGGVSDLKKKTGCEVIGPDKRRIPVLDRVVDDNQVLTIGNIEIHVIAAAGHTSTSVCYYVPASEENVHKILWTGDTLFTGGCGRILECSAQTMYDSLLKLVSLPDDTLVYCGHDYTLENYEFALTVEPDNKDVRQRQQEIKQTVKAGGFTVPSTILQEKRTNIFLRSDTSTIKNALKMPDAGAVDVFAELRRRKDFFRASVDI